MSNKTYDRLKTIALVIAPFCTLTSTILPIWNVPYSEQITATLVAIDTFLGVLVKIFSSIYNKKKETKLQEIKEINQQND